MWNGKPIYYHGYQDVLAGKKSIEEVMSCSDLQGVLVSTLHGYLYNLINRKKYLLATNEIGLHLALNDNLCNDIVIYEREKLGKLQGKYFDVAPKVVIEVDINADLSDFPNKADEYIIQKSQKLLDFGVEKILWVITSMQKVYIIEQGNPTWYIVNWSETIQFVDDCHLSIKQLLDEEDIAY
ncbi:hypothetical protein GCM10027592_49020 [Spirosoma flavus]